MILGEKEKKILISKRNGFELVARNFPFMMRIHIICSQYVNKQPQEFRY